MEKSKKSNQNTKTLDTKVQSTKENINPLEARGVDESAELANTGIYQAVCLNVIDLGQRENNFGKLKRQLLYIFEIDERYTKGKRKEHRHIVSKFYNLSLNKNSEIIQDLEQLRGFPYCETYDEETLQTTLWKNHKKAQVLNFADLIGQPLCLYIETKRGVNTSRVQTKITQLLRAKENQNFENENPIGYIPDWVSNMMNNENSRINYSKDDPPF